LHFYPPIAIARLGGSPIPLESYRWTEDKDRFGAGLTVVTPDVSLEVLPDGSVLPYLPGHIRFRDGGLLRPVCPFFDLRVQMEDSERDKPLTLKVLSDEVKASLANLSYRIVATNRKASRRTGDEACAFSAHLQIHGEDFRKHALTAFSPIGMGEPLVFQ